MSEETKSIRLSKAAKEFNIGVSTAVEFLKKKGHQIDDNPNTKIPEELYNLLAKNFQSERAVKENADKIKISTTVKNSAVLDASKELKDETPEQPKENDKETATKSAGKKVDTKEEVKTSEPAKEPAKKAKPKAKAEPKAKPEPKEVPVPEIKEEVKEEPKTKIIAPDTQIPDVPTDLSVKVIDHIDIDSINEQNRPTKRTKEQKEKERKERKKNSEAITKAMEKAAQQAEAESHKEEETPKPEPAPKPETIKAVAPKLEGPKILGKIDLPMPEQRTKPSKKEEGGRKKKRKRIGEGPVDINNPNNQGGNAPKKNEQRNEQPAGQGSGKKRDKKKAAKQPVVIDEKEIEKQIHDNLARLAPMGKSKT